MTLLSFVPDLILILSLCVFTYNFVQSSVFTLLEQLFYQLSPNVTIIKFYR